MKGMQLKPEGVNQMRTRLMTTAFLFNCDKILMMKRSADRKLAPGLWTGIGGHIEPHEIDDPLRSCIREIHEESGIEEDKLEELKLRYIIIRQKELEIREQFVYFGKTNKREIINTNEGDLYWISSEVIETLEMPWTIRSMFEHYFEVGIRTDKHYVSILTLRTDNIPEMVWTELIDPEVV
ncbi:NUDIX domain-containing protein [Paenibacillus montaniterrae]|nr:NUDIX domain-containing protein [Paenibacillus montaniterrae]